MADKERGAPVFIGGVSADNKWGREKV